MLFLKRQLPLVVSFLMGILLVAQYYVPHRASQDFYEGVQTWVQVIGAFALLMGAMALFFVHFKKVRRKEEGWGYSAVTIVSMFGMMIVGFVASGEGSSEGALTSFGWAYEYVYYPLTGTMFALLAFFIASAAFRAFRAKTVPAAVLLATAVVIMFTSVPLGDLIWTKLLGWTGIWTTDQIRDWFLNVANVAGKRAILFGVSLGVIATSLRVIVGIERAYLGSD
jgi:hypothetical protein